MSWKVLVKQGDDEDGVLVSENFSFLEEAEAFAERQRAEHPDADVYVTEELP